MQIDLSKEIKEQFDRLKRLAEEAEDSIDAKLNERASAMAPMTQMLATLVKSQESVINMERIMSIEAALLETMKELCDEQQHTTFLKNLHTRLSTNE